MQTSRGKKPSSHEAELRKWAKLISSEVTNPLTVAVEITRDIDFDQSYPDPQLLLVVKIKQKARVEDYGNAYIHGTAPPKQKVERKK